jgi:Protein of unknown function (DUF2851)
MAAFAAGEDLLQFIWQQQLFDRRALSTTEGAAVEVLRPGQVQHNAGPDLLNASVRVGGQLWAGNIEVHVRSSEWYAHGHEKDPTYNNVVLHVVHEHDAEVFTQAGARLPTVALNGRIAEEHLERYRALMQSRAWVPCAQQLHLVGQERIPFWLHRLSVERLQRKCQEVIELHQQLGGDALETFWHMLARGFGSKANVEAFAMLARTVSAKVVLKYRDDALRTEALLFGQAGLLQVDFVEEHPRQLQREYAVLAELHELQPMSIAAWQFGRLRPRNFPTVRIAQLAALLGRLDGRFDTLYAEDDLARLLPRLEVTAGDHWSRHYVFDRSTPEISPKRIGPQAARGLLINTIVPYRFAMGQIHGKPQEKTMALSLMEQMPAESNAVLKGWASIGLSARDACEGQGLLELKDQYCRQHRCLSCAIGAELLKRPLP